tara:strand:+ start:11201 stop:11389 length:189 start_codon:yes stop_codon:yes gene_type:complete
MNEEYIFNKLKKLIADDKIKCREAEDIYELYLEEIDDTSIDTAIERAEYDIEEALKLNSWKK